MSAADYDRTPTSAAERVRWRVSDVGALVHVVADAIPGNWVGQFATPELAACAVHDHNVMVAAREQRAMRDEAFREIAAGRAVPLTREDIARVTDKGRKRAMGGEEVAG